MYFLFSEKCRNQFMTIAFSFNENVYVDRDRDSKKEFRCLDVFLISISMKECFF